MEQFKDVLRSRGLKVTDSRKQIFRALQSSEDHFTADEFHDREFGVDGSVSRATVYRTLDVLEKCGFVRKVVLKSGKAYYESRIGNMHHHHMICIECDSIMEFPGSSLSAQLNVMAESRDFEVFCHDIKVHGICSECQQEKESEANRGGSTGQESVPSTEKQETPGETHANPHDISSSE